MSCKSDPGAFRKTRPNVDFKSDSTENAEEFRMIQGLHFQQ